MQETLILGTLSEKLHFPRVNGDEHDYSSRREELVQRPRKGLANWLTSTSTPLFVLDQRKVILVFNHGCEELTGWAAGDLIGKSCEQITEGNAARMESVTGMFSPPSRVLQGESAVVPVVLPTHLGSVPFEIHFFPLPQLGEEESIRILGVICPLSGAGIEVVPESRLRRFQLARLLAELHARYGIDSLVAQSPLMQRVVPQVKVASSHTFPIHLQGEPGTGKEHIARLIHYTAAKHNAVQQESRFLPLDCKKLSHFELSRTLRRLFTEPYDSTLIGTVYLKHVAELPRDLLEELRLHLQSNSPVRWMSSSLKGLEMEGEDRMPVDLMSQLTSFVIPIPPLKARREDLLMLALQLLERTNQQLKKSIEAFSPDVEEEFLAYQWPGNVEELSEVIAQAGMRSPADVILPEHLPLPFKAGRDAQRVRPLKVTESLSAFIERIEKERIQEVLQVTQGNKSTTAEILKIPRAKLYRRMLALGLLENGENLESQAEAIS